MSVSSIQYRVLKHFVEECVGSMQLGSKMSQKSKISWYPSLLNFILLLNEIWKILVQQNIKFKALAQLISFIHLLKVVDILWSYKKCQRMVVERGIDRQSLRKYLQQNG